MTAPEPVEVAADELAAAERRFRALATRYPMGGVDHARVLMAEYDRRRMLLDGEYQRGYTDGYLCGSGDRDETIAERDHLREHLSHSCSLTEYDRVSAERDRLRAFLLEATDTLPAYGFADNELGDSWPRWLERVAAYLRETHR